MHLFVSPFSQVMEDVDRRGHGVFSRGRRFDDVKSSSCAKKTPDAGAEQKENKPANDVQTHIVSNSSLNVQAAPFVPESFKTQTQNMTKLGSVKRHRQRRYHADRPPAEVGRNATDEDGERGPTSAVNKNKQNHTDRPSSSNTYVQRPQQPRKQYRGYPDTRNKTHRYDTGRRANQRQPISNDNELKNAAASAVAGADSEEPDDASAPIEDVSVKNVSKAKRAANRYLHSFTEKKPVDAINIANLRGIIF